MTAPVPLFVELCAGTAALSLRLERDGARPPVSRMGAKTGYADTILRVLGLMPGQRAERYLWCEPDPGVRLLLHAYRDAALAKAAAAIIRSWAAEDPRALWERLRAEGPPRLPDGEVDAGEVARWAFTTARTHQSGGGFAPEAYDDPARTGWPGAGPPRVVLASRITEHGTLPAAIAPDARQVDPREVARWAVSHALTGMSGGYDCASERAARGERWGGDVRDFVPNRMSRIDAMPATIAPDARAIDPGPALPPGTVVYADPPYLNTTGYAADLPRAEVVTLARRWAAAGAVVCISEAEAIPELVVEGWHTVRIDGERSGQKRTFSKQQAEWLTMNRPPAWTPSVQGALFGGAR